MRIFLVLLLLVLVPLGFWLGWRSHAPNVVSTPVANAPAAATSNYKDTNPTTIYAHNLMLRKGPDLRIYVRWLRGELTPTKRSVTPSFDDPESFFLNIHDGILRANIGDISHFLNSGGLGNSPLKDVTLSGDGARITLKGTLHKVVPLPIQVTGELSVVPDNKIKLHIIKIDVLKIPFKMVLGLLHVTVADLAGSASPTGVQINGNDIVFDTQTLLPPPHIRGELKVIHVVNPDIEEVFGNTEKDLARVDQWRNYLHLKGGSLDFGKLTMHQVDLIMIDISSDPWFDLDLSNYQKQLVNGYTHMTPQAGLQIFMPDLRTIPDNASTQGISLEWMKNRNAPVPSSVTKH